MQSTFTDLSVIISSNGRFKISVAEAMNQFTMPEYPATSENGIAHFIHSENSIQSDEKLARQEEFTSEMSKICWAYTRHVQGLHKYRFSFQFTILMMWTSSDWSCWVRLIMTMTAKHIIDHTNAVEFHTVNMLIQMCCAHALHMTELSLKTSMIFRKSQVVHIFLCQLMRE